MFDGPAGPLEGLWLPAGSRPRPRLTVLCHPHPLYGGTMETKLVARTARQLSESGFQTLRFNFRGVGESAGSWDEGPGEREDVRAALDYAMSRLPDTRPAVFGFSFGAIVGLDVGSRDDRVEALAGVAPPVGLMADEFLALVTKPILIVGAGRDTIVDPASLKDWAGKLKSPNEFRMFDRAEHMFVGEENEVAEVVTQFLRQSMS